MVADQMIAPWDGQESGATEPPPLLDSQQGGPILARGDALQGFVAVVDTGLSEKAPNLRWSGAENTDEVRSQEIVRPNLEAVRRS